MELFLGPMIVFLACISTKILAMGQSNGLQRATNQYVLHGLPCVNNPAQVTAVVVLPSVSPQGDSSGSKLPENVKDLLKAAYKQCTDGDHAAL